MSNLWLKILAWWTVASRFLDVIVAARDKIVEIYRKAVSDGK